MRADMMTSRAWAFLVMLVSVTATAAAPPDVQDIVKKLDVSSFPSSLGPRLEKGKTHFADYGFQVVHSDTSTARLEQPGKWAFQLRTMASGGGNGAGISVCLEDRALGGGTYHAQSALVLQPSPDQKSFVAKKAPTPLKDCPEFAK
jgi:hypothetical protein